LPILAQSIQNGPPNVPKSLRRIHDEQIPGQIYRPGVLFHHRVPGISAKPTQDGGKGAAAPANRTGTSANHDHAGEKGSDQGTIGAYVGPELIPLINKTVDNELMKLNSKRN
jgi:hypothetical protein